MKNNIEKFIYSLLAILFIGISAQLSIQLPEEVSSVPITGQSFAVLIIAQLLHGKWASLVSMAYLLLGLIGLPLFSAFSSGISVLTGPSGGYLFGFVLASFFLGNLASKQVNDAKHIFLQMIFGSSLILICGYLWLLQFLDFESAFSKGVKPFIAGAIVKSILAMVLLSVYYKLRSLLNNKTA